MPIVGGGRILMWQGGSLWIMNAPPIGQRPRLNEFHSHHAVQVTLALDGKFALDGGGCSISADAAAVAPDARHAFDAQGLCAHIFIEPESLAGRAVKGALFASAAIVPISIAKFGDLPRRLAAAFTEQAGDEATFVDLGRAVIRCLAEGVAAEVPDARVQKLLGWVTGQMDQRVSLADAAGNLGLSQARLRHLFVEQTGLPFRTYVLWLRLMRAVEAYAGGANLTDAAHEAGFADSAHLSRTFRRMFGMAATALRSG